MSSDLLIMANSVVLLAVAVVTLYNTYLTRRTELNTNSMKDALVTATKTASKAEGKAEERLESDQRAKDLLRQ